MGQVADLNYNRIDPSRPIYSEPPPPHSPRLLLSGESDGIQSSKRQEKREVAKRSEAATAACADGKVHAQLQGAAGAEVATVEVTQVVGARTRSRAASTQPLAVSRRLSRSEERCCRRPRNLLPWALVVMMEATTFSYRAACCSRSRPLRLRRGSVDGWSSS
jgi:hypothetical protein